jgi:hypothetical protein
VSDHGKSKKKQSAPKRVPSDRVGGPSNSRGINYQVHYAIRKALELILTAKTEPQRRCSISMEPRQTGAPVTAWDVHSSPPDELTEAKLDPSRADVLVWLARVRDASYEGAFILMCGRKRGELILDLEVLTRLANEAGGNPEKFQDLVQAQEISNATEILATLGPDHQALLQRMHVEHSAEESLKREVEFRARQIAATYRQNLEEFLFKKFSEGNQERRTFDVNDLIGEIERHGITLYTPPEIALIDERQEVVKTFFLLQRCSVPLPIAVVATTVELPVADLEQLLARF